MIKAQHMTDDLISSHLGYPLKPRDIPSSGFEQWCLTVKLSGGLVPVAFSREQALEIARRIYAHYLVGGIEEAVRQRSELLATPVCDARSTRTVEGQPLTWPKLP